MVAQDIIRIRLTSAEKFFRELSVSMVSDWWSRLDHATRSKDWIIGLTLIHPMFFAQDNGSSCKIRGPRKFDTIDKSGVCYCQSKLIWGYECPFKSEFLEADHMFPYAFGGPSISTNKIYLCKEHNRSKASDVHLFPWEFGNPEWLERILERISNFKKLSK